VIEFISREQDHREAQWPQHSMVGSCENSRETTTYQVAPGLKTFSEVSLEPTSDAPAQYSAIVLVQLGARATNSPSRSRYWGCIQPRSACGSTPATCSRRNTAMPSWSRATAHGIGGDIAVVSLNENGTVKSVDPNPCARDVALDFGRTTMPRIAALLMLRSTMKTVSARASRSFRGSLPHARMMSGASAVNSAAFARVVGIARGPADVDVQVATFEPLGCKSRVLA
jgi:hypothetical protein